MTKLIRNWKIGILGVVGLIVFQIAAAKLEDDFKIIKTIVPALDKWATDFFDMKNKKTLTASFADLDHNVLKPSFVLLTPKEAPSYTPPEKLIRSMVDLMHAQLNKMCASFKDTANFKVWLAKFAKNLSNQIGLADVFTKVDNQFQEIIQLVKDTKPQLAKEMIIFKQNVLDPMRQKWTLKCKQNTELLAAIRHRCNCK